MELIKSSRPDVILMDVSMPGEDGISFCRNLKTSQDTASIPVLILTAFSDGNTFNDAMLFGASGFIAKPFELNEVTKKIESCIAKATIKKEHKK
jgi:CheY-like chemotaxis protein